MSLHPLGLLLLLALPAWPGVPDAGPGLSLWRMDPAGFTPDPRAGDAPLAVGSLQKPFVALAWARTHPGQAPPRLACPGGQACWNPSGHGELGLLRATALSCNAYFQALARATPLAALEGALREAGFHFAALSPRSAVGLGEDPAPVRIRPSALLAAYLRLARSPWASGDAVRQEVLAGLREVPLTGTASALGRHGLWVKTGTVPLPSDPLATRGLALAVDDAGSATLVRRDPGTGAQAAVTLARTLTSRMGPGPGQDPALVTVRLFGLLGPGPCRVRNLEGSPVPWGREALGAGAERALRPGERVGPGLLELSRADRNLRRRLRGSLAMDGRGRVTATLAPREYVEGVVAAELPGGDPLREDLGAAVLRFLARGPRHPDADLCDATHCAWYVGRGPLPDWSRRDRAREVPGPPAPWGFTDAQWERVIRRSLQPGPDQWTSHCGGQPLSPRSVWGRGSAQAPPCPRHGPDQTRPWVRDWSLAELRRAFAEEILDLEAGESQGQRVLWVTGPRGRHPWSYDQAHRRLAPVLGWDALPSPPDRAWRVPGGFRVQGRGSGHRVGLCLAPGGSGPGPDPVTASIPGAAPPIPGNGPTGAAAAIPPG